MTSYKNFRDITFGGGRFIGVTQQGVIYTSSNGENWTDYTVLPIYTNDPDLTAAIYNGSSYFVAANHSDFDFNTFLTTNVVQLMASTDGTTWTEAGRANDVQAQSLGWDGSQLLMGTTTGDILTSADGVSWVLQEDVIATNDTVTAFASNQTNLTVATGWHRALITSPDGLNWTTLDHRKTTQELAVGWNDVNWTGSKFVTVDAIGIIASSTDGATWTDDEAFKDAMSLSGVASIGDQVVAVGGKPKMGGGSEPAVVYEGALSISANAVPAVNAGTDQTVTANTTVSLTGMASDVDGSIAIYLWEQTAGTTVTLAATDAVDSSFTAPDITVAETLTFTFTATDNSSESSSDSVAIIVEPVSTAGSSNTPSETSNDSSDSGGGAITPWWILLLSLMALAFKRRSI